MHRIAGLNQIKNVGKVLVTGAGGFVGGYLCRYLHRFGVSVRAMVRPGFDSRHLQEQGIEVVEADLLDPASLERAVDGVDAIAHIAALFRRAELPESVFYQVNVAGTASLLEAATKAGVRRFVHCSTVGVHSNIIDPPGDESTPYSPHDDYQRSKMQGEQLVLEAFKQGKISGVVIRPAMIYGPGDERTLKLFRTISQRRFFYVGSGNAHVHFIDVRDLVRAFALALVRSDISGETFIISGKESVPLRELVGRVADIFGVPAPKVHLPLKPVQILGSLCESICRPFKISPPIFRRRVDFFVNNRHFTSKKAEKLLGFSPTLSLDQELQEIIDWYVVHGAIDAPLAAGKLRADALPASTRLNGIDTHPFDHKGSEVDRLSVEAEAVPGNESVLIRSLEGTIGSWKGQCQQLYGWDRFEAEGRISHYILRTEFPMSLKLINQELMETKVWRGKLLHKNRKGQEIEVDSLWSLHDSGDPDNESFRPYVLERNVPTAQSTSFRDAPKGFASQSGFLFLMDSLSFL